MRRILDFRFWLFDHHDHHSSHPKSKIQNPKYARILSLIFVTLLVLGPANILMACPGCKEAFFDPGQLTQKLSTARAYALSIGLLLTMPAGLLSLITYVVFRAYRRHRRSLGEAGH